jgi:predicted dinucleotide-binding enzyme
MRIAVLGAGNVGRAVGEGWTRAGHTVVYGVPTPGDAKHADLGRDRVWTVAEAAEAADVVVIATPWPATRAALQAAGDLGGRIVVDCTNPLAHTPDAGLHLATGFTTSGGEMVAGWAPGAFVFKTLNQTGAEIMADARAFVPPPVMFVAGDDEGRKATVLGLVGDLGFEAVDGGPLANARLLEPFAMVWIDQALKRGLGRDFAFALARQPG